MILLRDRRQDRYPLIIAPVGKFPGNAVHRIGTAHIHVRRISQSIAIERRRIHIDPIDPGMPLGTVVFPNRSHPVQAPIAFRDFFLIQHLIRAFSPGMQGDAGVLLYAAAPVLRDLTIPVFLFANQLPCRHHQRPFARVPAVHRRIFLIIGKTQIGVNITALRMVMRHCRIRHLLKKP